jgi:hypothetical protein
MEINANLHEKSTPELRAEIKISYRNVMKQIEGDIQKTTFPYVITLNGVSNLDKGKAMLLVKPISPKKLSDPQNEQKYFLMITDYGLKEFEATPELEGIVNKRLDLQIRGEKFPKKDPENMAQNYEGYEDGGFAIIDPEINQRSVFMSPSPDIPTPDSEDLKTAIITSRDWVKKRTEESPEAKERKEAIAQLQNAESVSNVLNETLGSLSDQ